MTPEQKNAVVDLVLGRITHEKFVSRFGLDPAGQPGFAEVALRDALASRDAGTVECAYYLALHFDLLTISLAPVLAELLLQPWHNRHEDIAKELQSLRDPATADALAEAAVNKLEYLAYDDSHPLARKCTWALADIGTPEARMHLERLAHNSDAEIAGYAQKRLDNWEREMGRKGLNAGQPRR